ncbi:MAG: HAMP domain-containing histidine kinase [Oscillospiraceae bacterium]|nr:HAMP domain-containing histidine kinase [Oscillospiraceae bacterium]
MGGLITACILLTAACLVLLVRYILLNYRIRKLAEQVDSFNSGTAQMLDVALQEDRLAQLHNGIADLQLSLVRARQLNTEECSRTSQLTADISHQLKTPLTTLRLYTELDNAPHMEASLEQIQRMENLIQALLRLERLCADGYAFHFAPADAETIIREQWQSLQAVFPEKKLIIDGSAHIRCDEKWLGEAFLNLLKNACEHTSDGGVIRIYLERTEAAFFCVIEDDGGGVPKEELPKLFRRFYRAQHQSKNGAGIGLAIVKEIIQRHHGNIVAENGKTGLKMTISMPMLDRSLTNS